MFDLTLKSAPFGVFGRIGLVPKRHTRRATEGAPQAVRTSRQRARHEIAQVTGFYREDNESNDAVFADLIRSAML